MTKLSANKKSIVVEKPGLNVSMKVETAFELNKADFKKTFKKRLGDYTDTVYSEIQGLKKVEESEAPEAPEKVEAK